MNTLAIDLIRIDGGTQPRAHLNPETVTEYANAMADDGCVFPPVTVFYDGADYWLADGFHRVAASKEAGFADIDADVRQGTRRDAVLFSVGANADHGLRRTNEDKRRAVLTLLNDSEWAGWSDREIARQCGVSHPFVSSLRPAPSGNGCQIDRTVTRGGTTYQQNTANIGRTREPRDEPPPAPPPPRPVPRSQIATTVTQDTPEERRISRHSGFVLEASDRLLAAVECWPDPADAAPHLEGYAVFLEQLPIVASWLGRLDELLKAASTPEHLATE